MFNLTEPAKQQLEGYFADKTISPIRVFLSQGGCSGPQLVLALDEPKDSDDTFDFDKLKFVVDKDLLKEAAPITIDFTTYGFIIDSGIKPTGGGCSCCSGSCGGE